MRHATATMSFICSRSPSLGGSPLAESGPATASWRETEIAGPYEDDLILVQRRMRIGPSFVTIRVGEDDEPIDRAGASFAHEMAVFLTALGAALALAAWLQVELGLLPLRRVRRELAAMERNPAVLEAMLQAGHEIASHGLRWINYGAKGVRRYFLAAPSAAGQN